MNNNWFGIQRIVRLDATNELQQRGRIVGNAVVGPRSELELTDLSRLQEVALSNKINVTTFETPLHKEGNFCLF